MIILRKPWTRARMQACDQADLPQTRSWFKRCLSNTPSSSTSVVAHQRLSGLTRNRTDRPVLNMCKANGQYSKSTLTHCAQSNTVIYRQLPTNHACNQIIPSDLEIVKAFHGANPRALLNVCCWHLYRCCVTPPHRSHMIWGACLFVSDSKRWLTLTSVDIKTEHWSWAPQTWRSVGSARHEMSTPGPLQNCPISHPRRAICACWSSFGSMQRNTNTGVWLHHHTFSPALVVPEPNTPFDETM